MKVEDARISKTNLGVAYTDHGILSATIMLDFGSGGQGFGGVTLDGINPKHKTGDGVPSRIATTGASSLLLAIDAVFGCDWEDLKDKKCRAYYIGNGQGIITALGHEVRDMWLWWDERLIEYNYGTIIALQEFIEDTTSGTYENRNR